LNTPDSTNKSLRLQQEEIIPIQVNSQKNSQDCSNTPKATSMEQEIIFQNNKTADQNENASIQHDNKVAKESVHHIPGPTRQTFKQKRKTSLRRYLTRKNKNCEYPSNNKEPQKSKLNQKATE
jgi:hypothetical protein